MASLPAPMRAPRLRRYWMRLALRQVHYTDRVDKFDRLYMIEDPWEMAAAKEQARFGWTDRLIVEHLAPAGSILEIGCGEGHQSCHLARLCDRLYGIDVSVRAVQRARRRCPEGRFAAGDPFALGFADIPSPVDLVAACEVLYYVKDIPRFIARISQLGRACLVTYYSQHAANLDPHFAALADCRRERFRFGEVEWIAVWWRNRGD